MPLSSTLLLTIHVAGGSHFEHVRLKGNHLKNEIWEDVYLHTDVNRAYSSFLTKYLKYFVNIFPLKNYLKIKVSNQNG
jgi:hypothetical protein